jgi:hypothetical protein
MLSSLLLVVVFAGLPRSDNLVVSPSYVRDFAAKEQNRGRHLYFSPVI